MTERTIRQEMLLGEAAMARLRGAHVAVFGLGGVGSYAAEALCRAGVGELTLVDGDVLSRSNCNRQLYALESTIGRAKATVAAERCRDINPDVVLHPVIATYDEAHSGNFFPCRYDYIIDAIDLVSCKLSLIGEAMAQSIPILTALGTGNKLDPEKLTITDISKTHGDPLARVMRKELRARGIEHLKVCFSPEEPLEPTQPEAPPPGRRSVPGSVSWVPSVAGLLMAGTVIRDIVEK